MTPIEAINSLRAYAKTLPAGKKFQVLNRCDRIAIIMKQGNISSKNESKAIADRYNAAKAIASALLAKRVLSYKDEPEFYTSQFHTSIIKAREIIEKKYPEFKFMSKWTSDGGHPYKLYWLEEK